MIAEAIMCLALNIYHEARNQSTEGQEAIAAVTMTRANFNPSNVCDVVFKPMQFSWANPLTTVGKEERVLRSKDFIPKESKAWIVARRIAAKAINGELESPAYGATHYYNFKLADPYWKKGKTIIVVIGEHIFLK